VSRRRTLTSYIGARVAFDREIRNGFGVVKRGTPLTVTSAWGRGLVLDADACASCGVSWSVRIRTADLYGMTILAEAPGATS
jgi:hypothetical protein